jgi:hypothetical protein
MDASVLLIFAKVYGALLVWISRDMLKSFAATNINMVANI